jgi:hypothetical protein
MIPESKEKEADKGQIKVTIRVRPLNDRERQEDICIKVDPLSLDTLIL